MIKTANSPKASRNTWQAMYTMFGPMALSNFTMLLVLILYVILQPKVNDPSTYWAIGVLALLMLVAGVLMVKGLFRFRLVHRAHKEDQRRIAAGLPLEPERDDD